MLLETNLDLESKEKQIDSLNLELKQLQQSINEEKMLQTTYDFYYEGEFQLNGAKANSTHIGSEFKKYFVVGDSANNTRLFDF